MAAKVPARDTMAIIFLAIFFTLVVVVNGQIVFPEDERGVRDCVEGGYGGYESRLIG